MATTQRCVIVALCRFASSRKIAFTVTHAVTHARESASYMEVTLVRTVRRTFLLAVTLIAALSASPAFAQDQRVWIDVNIGLAGSAAGAEAFVFNGILYGEPAALGVPIPNRHAVRRSTLAGDTCSRLVSASA